MEIRNSVNHKAIGFGNSVVIKSREMRLLNMLAQTDALQWKDRLNPKFRYNHLSIYEGKDGFYSGLLADNAEKNALHCVYKLQESNLKKNTNTLSKDSKFIKRLTKNIAQLSKTIEIKTAEEVAELLKLKTVDDIIKRFAK